METNSAREELLRLSSEKLLNKVKSTMYSINLLLSHPERSSYQVDTLVDLLKELAIHESALNHSNSLLSQCLALKLQDLTEQSNDESGENAEKE